MIRLIIQIIALNLFGYVYQANLYSHFLSEGKIRSFL